MRSLLSFQFSSNGLEPLSCEPAAFAIPLAIGQLFSVSKLTIVDVATGGVIPAQIQANEFWHDGSVKWIDVRFTLIRKTGVVAQYALAESTEVQNQTNQAIQQEELFDIKFEVGSKNIYLGIKAKSEIASFVGFGAMSLSLVDLHGQTHHVPLQLANNQNSNSALMEYMVLTGSCPVDGKTLKLQLDLCNHQRLALLEAELTIHNPAAAIHAKGLWDLGDPASIYFKEIYLQFESESISNIEVHSETHTIRHVDTAQQLSVGQYSSGGKNRQSANHMRFDGTVGDLSSGYKIFSGESVLEQGDRVAPILLCDCSSGSTKLAFHIHQFWQEFPTEISASSSGVRLSLFAQASVGPHEIQAGEKKRRRVSCLSVRDEQDYTWLRHSPSQPMVTGGELDTCDELFGRALTLTSSFDKKLGQLLVPPEEFINKRERIDEYGWRNFGDVFADHESLYTEDGDDLLVSHYNNQYDILLGFGLQYLRTKEKRWFELMNDLARHVVDIDIYHTDLDRAEFNHGLFWHTNHYENAYTCSHRTFSEKNYDAKHPRSGSGGPAREHCYTAGLLLHYRLTGDKRSADAVIDLARWILNCHEGDGSVKSTLRSVAKHEARNIVQILRSVRAPVHRYHFDRGTGNLVEACLNAFEVSNDRQWLESAGAVLLDTFSSADDIETRSLDNIERWWHYIVFLQAAVRFLCVKKCINEDDDVSIEVHAAFVHYARWMLTNETPYMENKSRLEFVNDTWVAQDVRKHTLLVSAAVFDKAHAARYLARAAEFEEHIIEHLSASDTLAYTRIQALLMLNIGVGSAISNIEAQAAPNHSVIRTPSTVLGELVEAVQRVSACFTSPRNSSRKRLRG